MLLAGDEMGNSQDGNNNAYCQDNEVSWLDWEGMTDDDRALLAFTRRLIALRRDNPAFRRQRFFTGATLDDTRQKDIAWLSPTGREMTPEDWTLGYARCLGMLLGARPGEAGPFTVLMNAHHEPLPFQLPDVPIGGVWRLLIDTHAGLNGARNDDTSQFDGSETYSLAGRSLVVLQAHPGNGIS
jgi:glycogen operon protein